MTVEKTKAITPTNHNRGKHHDEPITIPSNYLKLAPSAIGSGFTSHSLKNWHKSFKPIIKHNNRNNVITFDSHLKTALFLCHLACHQHLIGILRVTGNA